MSFLKNGTVYASAIEYRRILKLNLKLLKRNPKGQETLIVKYERLISEK